MCSTNRSEHPDIRGGCCNLSKLPGWYFDVYAVRGAVVFTEV